MKRPVTALLALAVLATTTHVIAAERADRPAARTTPAPVATVLETTARERAEFSALFMKGFCDDAVEVVNITANLRAIANGHTYEDLEKADKLPQAVATRIAFTTLVSGAVSKDPAHLEAVKNYCDQLIATGRVSAKQLEYYAKRDERWDVKGDRLALLTAF